ncbi:MAG: DUF4214 domain-containing protein, partial [Ruthenibacterium sp.]
MKLKRTIAMLLVAGMMLSIVPAFAADDNSLAPVAPATETQIVEAPVETPVTPPAETPVAPPAASTSAPASASSEASVPASSTASSTAASSEVPVPSSSTSEDIIVAPDSTSALPQGELVDGGVADLGEDGAAPEVLDANVTAFMTRLYKSCFDREPDAAGLAAWVGYLKNGMSGTDVTMHFFHSQEFSNLNTIDTEFLNSLYYVVFNRAVDESGAESWIRAMGEDGLSRDWVLSNVLASPEFANVCRDYGIQQGAYKSTQPRD